MDILNDTVPPSQNPAQFIGQHKMVVGTKQLKKVLISGQASCVFLAEDADPSRTEPIEQLCLQYHVAYYWVPHMAELGQACRIEVGAAAAAAVD